MRRQFLKPVLAFVVFCVMQVMGSVIMGVTLSVTKIVQGEAVDVDKVVLSPSLVLTSILVTGFLTILVCWRNLRVIEMRQAFNARVVQWFAPQQGHSIFYAFYALIASIMGVVALNLLSEMSHLPNVLGDLMIQMASNPFGLVIIGIAGPVVEELVFREGIIGGLTRNGVSPWVAILTSAALFGLAHFNPVQCFFAGLMGVVLGILYYKTGNIVLCGILHILNNSIAVIQMIVLGEKALDYSFVDELGGVLPACLCVVLFGGVCCYALYEFWNNYSNREVA